MQSDTPDTSAPAPTQFKFPVITIPEDATLSEHGEFEFTIPTSEGVVNVCGYRWGGAFCNGNLAALVKAGLMLPQWAPGLPGNNKISQRVVFDEEHPRLIICSRGGRPFNGPHITIIRKSRITFQVQFPLTEEQRKLGEAKETERREKEALKKTAAKSASVPTREECGMTLERAHAVLLNRVRGIPDHIEWAFKGSQHGYSFHSMNKIMSSLEALAAALANAPIVRLEPKYSRVGNVIQFPLRTR